jgi:hypothetical protein
VHQLLLLHLHLGELELHRAALLFDLHRVQVLIEEVRSCLADRVGLGEAFDGRTRGIDCGVGELGHGNGS